MIVEVLTGWGLVFGLQWGDYVIIECPDCDGQGFFEMPDGDRDECVMCKNCGIITR